MLIKFICQNFRSIRDEVVLDMGALGRYRGEHPSHLIEDERGEPTSVLRVAAIYGANASGKSNLIKAMAVARRMVVEGVGREDPLPVVPCRLDPEWALKPSVFQFILKLDGRLYDYGFAATASGIVEEWLLELKGGRERVLFQREIDDGRMDYRLGDGVADTARRAFLLGLGKSLDDHDLFLFECLRKQLGEIGFVGEWFRKKLRVILPEMPLMSPSPVGSQRFLEIPGGHGRWDGLPVAEESEGLQRLQSLTPELFSPDRHDMMFVIDELDRSLHPIMTFHLISEFLRIRPSRGSQLLFTTHETHLLDLDLLRRDEIWFMERDRSGASRLYSLAEFKPRNDKRIEKGYLQGRYGAIPFLGDIQRLGDEADEPPHEAVGEEQAEYGP